MSSEYGYHTQVSLTSESSEFDIGDDMTDLLQKVNNLTLEKEDLQKQLRESHHDKDLKITELTIENEKLAETVESLEELISVYKAGNNSNSKLEAKKLLSEQESKISFLEQAENNLKRKNYELTLEISSLKMENERILLMKDIKEGFATSNEYADDLNLEEARNLLNELVSENDELKKESSEIKEKALNALMEKEMENMNLREEMEQLKNSHTSELHKLILDIQYLNTQLEVFDLTKKKLEDELSSAITTQDKALLKSKALETEYKKLKNEFDTKESQWESDRENLLKVNEHNEQTFKQKLREMELDLVKLRSELGNKDLYREELTQELNQKVQTKEILQQELANLHDQLKSTEEQKEKNESVLNQKLEFYKNEIIEFESMYKDSLVEKSKLESDIEELRLDSERKYKELSSSQERNMFNKDGEIKNLSKKIEILERELVALKNEYNNQKVNFEKSKHDFVKLNEHLKQLREVHEADLKKLEEKHHTNIKKFENEKKQLNDQMNLLKTLPLTNANVTLTTSDNALSEALKHEEENPHYIELRYLKSENEILLGQISDTKLKLSQISKQLVEFDHVKKENTKLKSDLKDLKKMYEDQITDLQKKMTDLNNELQKQKRRLTHPSDLIEQAIKETVAGLSDTNKLEKEAEVKFLNDKVKILSSELEKLKALRENDIIYYKGEIKFAEDIAVSARVELATLAYEKDTEILKYKNLAKKQAAKIKNFKNGIFQSPLKSPQKQPSFKGDAVSPMKTSSKISGTIELKFS